MSLICTSLSPILYRVQWFLVTGMSMFSKITISNGMSPFVFVAYRQAFATVALAPFAFFLDRKQTGGMSYGLIWKVFLLSLFGITLSLNLYSYAINYVSATFASASINTIPALTFVIAVAFRIESFSVRDFPGMLKIVGSMISLSGSMVFAFVKGPKVNLLGLFNGVQENKPNKNLGMDKEKWVQGCLLMLLANIAWAGWLVMLGPVVRQYPAKFRLTMLQCLFSCIQTSIWAVAIERDFSSWKLNWDFNLFTLVYCGVLVTGICYWLQLWAVEKKGPLFTATFTPLILIFTAILSAVIWKEMLYLGSICGGILLVGGLYFVIWGKNKEAAEKEANNEGKSEETNNV
ncbi:nodulin MtN21 /EamA-like transporter family protein [Striga asiatica]|uniref:WAT1-related protein n=1 Tax=Striga asiatica TaxID=4170 RepID=A0A5A7QSB4_STRAF|nr:nodulin MtN21 /EamA-like transporter family protein [Striga asiatica]